MPNPVYNTMNNNNDRCGCRCYNVNGVVVLLVAQILLLIAACFSTVAILDCQFVEVDSHKVAPELEEIFKNMFNKTITVKANNNKRGLGFFFYEGGEFSRNVGSRCLASFFWATGSDRVVMKVAPS